MQKVAGDLLHLRPDSAAYALHQRDNFFPPRNQDNFIKDQRTIYK